MYSSTLHAPRVPVPANQLSITEPKKPQLLVQMEAMLSSWALAAPQLLESHDESVVHLSDLQQKLNRLETCRSVLGLFASGSGVYQHVLREQFAYLFDLVDSLATAVNDFDPQSSSAPTGYGGRNFGPGGELVAIEDESMSKFDFAFNRVSRTNYQMKELVQSAEHQRRQFEAELAAAHERIAKLEELLKFQDNKLRRARHEEFRSHDVEFLFAQVTKEKTIEELQAVIDKQEENERKLKDQVADLLKLNALYAQQAVELAARMRVYNDHNQKFATLLALQQEEHLMTARENELLAKELEEMNRFHQLREGLEGDISTLRATFELRNVRHGLGANIHVPRHLAYCGLLNRFNMPKESALALVSDILAMRMSHGRRLDFHTFLHNYLTKKHGVDAVAWGYSLDDATRFYDADVNLAMFGLVSRKHISESLYATLHTDTGMFLEACEMVDQVVNGEVSLTIPLVHVMGLLIEMFPSYPESAFKRLFDNLKATLTSSVVAHYRMLFPNLERDLLGDPGTTFVGIELRRENDFSATFKELVVDDAVVTVQMLEDHLHHCGSEIISIDDMATAVSQVFESEAVKADVLDVLKRIYLDLCGPVDEMAVPKHVAINMLRLQTLFRRGVYRTEAATARNQKLMAQLIAQNTPPGVSFEEIDYREVLQKCETKRHTGGIEANDAPGGDVRVGLTML